MVIPPRRLGPIVAVLASLLLAGCSAAPTSPTTPTATAPIARGAPSPSPSPRATPSPTPGPFVPKLTDTVVQSGLRIPWDLDFAPDGRMFVTERAGNILVFESGQPNARRLANIAVPNVRAQGEAGLMGIAVDPDFARNGFVYVCASRTDEDEWRNQVLRYRAQGNDLTLDRVLIRTGMRAANIHDGCRMVFGPDRKLYITMGDAAVRQLSQDLGSLNGKLLRINPDGSIPEDNPIMPGATARTAIYAMGLRNSQGLAFEPGTSRLFLVEHGSNVHDEINLIRPGGNYGWPVLEGPGGTDRGFIDPLWSSGSSTIANSGGAFVHGPQWGQWSGSLMVATLKERDLRRFVVQGETVTPAEILLDETYGRLRSVVLAADGSLYVTTSNGSGDRIIRIAASRP